MLVCPVPHLPGDSSREAGPGPPQCALVRFAGLGVFCPPGSNLVPELTWTLLVVADKWNSVCLDIRNILFRGHPLRQEEEDKEN